MRLEIVQHHSLGVAAAKEHLHAVANGHLPSGVQLLKAVWEEPINRLTLDLKVRGLKDPVQATVNILPTEVDVTTSELPWYSAPFLPFIKAELQATLQKVLV